MSGFSIDDILAEVAQKRVSDKKGKDSDKNGGDGATAEIDEILNKNSSAKPKASRKASRKASQRALDSYELPPMSETVDASEKQRVSRFSAVSKASSTSEMPEMPEVVEEIKEVEPVEEPYVPEPYVPELSAEPEVQFSETIRKPERTEPEIAPKKKRERKFKADFKTDEIIFKKAMVTPKPVIDEPEPVEVAEVPEAVEVAEPVEPVADSVAETEPAKANRGAVFSIGGDKSDKPDETFDFPSVGDTRVLDDALKKRGEALLERDMSLEQPLEQIDALNPYDMLEAIDNEAQNETPVETETPVDSEVLDISENAERSAIYVDTSDDYFNNAKLMSLLSGDTKGIADGDLKDISVVPTDIPQVSKTAEIVLPEDIRKASPIRAVRPLLDNEDEESHAPSPLAESVGATIVLSEKAKRSNTALVESLNKALKKRRESDVNAYRTLTVEGEFEADSEGSEPVIENRVTHGLNIDYKKQIISDTAISLGEDPLIAEQRLRELAGKRKRKIRDFVLEDIEDDNGLDNYDEQEDSDEFDDYDTSGQIWSDLCETHKGLKVRFAILLILTGFALFLTVMNDLGISLAYNVLGADLLLLDKTYETTGYLILNLILGIAGALVCSTVVSGGLTKLFTGRGDCDSLCAVPAVLSVLCVLPHLSGESYIMQGYTNIFIAAGLAGLLFNTAGKLMMMSRAKRNFRFVSGDSTKYYADIIEDEQLSRAFTKGALSELPILCTIRKTEFLTDFLKNSYCNDRADRLCKFLTPAAFGAALIIGLVAFILPYENPFYHGNVFWAVTAANAALCLLSPLSIMFLVNNPLLRASKALAKNDAVVLGYNSAETFSKVNSVLVDASSLFPAGSVDFRNLKRCQQENSLNRFAIDDAIITAASLAIKSGSILTSMFYDMIAGKSELLYEIDNCIYEVNMGISGWLGNKRVMLGNRDQMKHHAIKVPDIKKEQQYSDKFGEVVYLAVGGETIAMFFIKIVANEQIKQALQSLQRSGVAIIVRTRDSLVTAHSLAEAFDLAPESLRVIPFDLHTAFDECTKYSSRGDGNVACNGTFSSFASALTAAKKVTHNIILSSSSLFIGLLLAVILCIIFTVFANAAMLTPTNVILYNAIFFILLMLMQGFKKY